MAEFSISFSAPTNKKRRIWKDGIAKVCLFEDKLGISIRDEESKQKELKITHFDTSLKTDLLDGKYDYSKLIGNELEKDGWIILFENCTDKENSKENVQNIQNVQNGQNRMISSNSYNIKNLNQTQNISSNRLKVIHNQNKIRIDSIKNTRKRSRKQLVNLFKTNDSKHINSNSNSNSKSEPITEKKKIRELSKNTISNSKSLKLSKSKSKSKSKLIVDVVNKGIKVKFCGEFKNEKAPIIPDMFSGIQNYFSHFENAVIFEMNHKLNNIAQQLYSLDTQFIIQNGKMENGNSPYCSHNKRSILCTVRKNGPNKGKMFWSCSSKGKESCRYFKWYEPKDGALKKRIEYPFLSNHENSKREDLLKRGGIDFYYNIEMVHHLENKNLSKKYLKDSSLYLRFHGNTASDFSINDVWVLSNNMWFINNEPGKDTKEHNFMVVCRSVFHGPSQDGFLEITPIDRSTSLPRIRRLSYAFSSRLFALHLGNIIVTELMILDSFSDLNLISNYQHYHLKIPIMFPFLLRGHSENKDIFKENKPNNVFESFSRFIPTENFLEIRNNFCEKYKLNDDQKLGLEFISKWFLAKSEPIVLIHGAYGCGKSYLIACLILFTVEILSYLPKSEKKISILVCAATNIAVDRILLQLLDMGFSDFMRVGSYKKIDYRLRQNYTIESKYLADNENDLKKELISMLRMKHSRREDSNIKRQLMEIREGIYSKKSRALKTSSVVGVTCASSVSDLMKDCVFPIVFLDEISQQIEPLSFLACTKGAQKLCAVGDPLQLPPNLSSSPVYNLEKRPSGLNRTLFDRMKQLKFPIVKLRYQYRCHPTISRICSTLFYEGQIKNGVNEVDRPSLVNGLFPLTLIDLEKKSGDKVFSANRNEEEANCIFKIVKFLLQKGISSSNIGIISLYKAQVSCIKELIDTIYDNNGQNKSNNSISVATIDSYQGQEKDIIILATTQVSKVTGFSTNSLRLNGKFIYLFYIFLFITNIFKSCP